MDSEDDVQPLINNDNSEGNIDIYLELTAQTLNADLEYDQVVYGYRKSRWRVILVYLVSVLTAGIPLLLFHWCPTWRLYLTCLRCCFQVADQVLVIETYQRKHKSFYIHRILEKNIADTSGLLNEGFQDEVSNEKEENVNAQDSHTPIHLDDGTTLTAQSFRYFRHKKQCLVWDTSRAQFALLAGVESGATCTQLQAMAARPPSSEKRTKLLNIYGLNEIKVPVQSVMTLVILEVFNPFYMFQVFTIAVWLAEPYYYYCIAVVLMSTFGVATSVIQTKKNQSALRATVEAHDTVQLWRGRRVDSRHVCPGDVIVLPTRGCVMLFDAALINGSVVVNESMLTGESVPVTKTALQRIDKPFHLKEHASSILFCGTSVTQVKYYNNEPVRALVLRTGYNTTKGQLVRSILYPVPADFKFDRDSYKFIIILACIAVVGLAYTVGLKAYRNLTPGDIVIKALDIITIVVPPALPAAMTVGKLYAVSRLKRARIACLNTRAVNVSGSLDAICFDKTGTLTEDGLDMWGVVPVSHAHSPRRLAPPVRDPRGVNDLHQLKLGMATCHSLALIDGTLAGDPLDLKMFESTGWSLEQPDIPDSTKYDILTPTIVRPARQTVINVDDVNMPLEVGIVKQQQFVSSLQRSSVVARVASEDVLRVYCKGAPETLAGLCREDTVPEDLATVLHSYAEKGYRVIAMATKMMEVFPKELDTMTREEMEMDLEFLGLVIMDNRLKPATAAVIQELKEANIHVVMITGDNIHTAVSVAKECGILNPDERVVSVEAEGEHLYCQSSLRGVLRTHYPGLIPRVISRGAVFARMSADQKQQLVVDYQALGYYVGMCGDGANDCGALKAAHTGISLSELESSVAAPFTSALPHIRCVALVLREGRAALTTSFGVFKFMVAYSLTEFFSVAFLYFFDANLTDFQFLYIDVALIVNFAFFFGLTEAYTGKLCKVPPLTSLLGLVPLLSLVGQMVLIGVIQFLSYYALTFYPWYVRHTYEGDEANECWENYAVYAVSMFQYIILAIVFSHGAPYRRSVVTNKQLMLSLIIMTGLCIYITVAPAQWLAEFLQLKMPLDASMTYAVLILAMLNFILALFFERFIIQHLMESKQMIPRCLKERRVRKTPYLMLQRQLSSTDYLECDSFIKYDKETSASDVSNGRNS